MHELVFPVAAIALVYVVVVPLLTLVSVFVLRRHRRGLRSWVDFGSQKVFAWLVVPTALPTAWLLSSALHQNETGGAQAGCLHFHPDPNACVDVQLLLAFLVVGLIAVVTFGAWRERPHLPFRPATAESMQVERVAALVNRDLRLQRLKVVVAQEAPSPVFTVGILSPQVVVTQAFLERNDDEVVLAALLHEYAHVRGRDTLRSFLVLIGLSLNPLGYCLRRDFHRWRCAREGQCDQEAVWAGSQALALAEGIVSAARSYSPGSKSNKGGPNRGGRSAFLGGCASASLLRLRLALLFDEGPRAPVQGFGHAILAVALLGVLTFPHLQGLGVLEVVHSRVESLFHDLYPH